MWLTEIETNKEDQYEQFTVDGITFYKIKEEFQATVPRRRRYSDVLKDPIYSQRNINRKLNLIKRFKEKNGDVPTLIGRWKELIGECIIILQKDYEIKASDVFTLFDLPKYGFDLEEFE